MGITPSSSGGFVVASVFMIASGMYMALPLGIVGNAFSQVWADRDRLLVMKRFQTAFIRGGISMKKFDDIFSMYDEDQSGTLDLEEFCMLLKTLQIDMDEERITMLMDVLDRDCEGQITRDQL